MRVSLLLRELNERVWQEKGSVPTRWPLSPSPGGQRVPLWEDWGCPRRRDRTPRDRSSKGSGLGSSNLLPDSASRTAQGTHRFTRDTRKLAAPRGLPRRVRRGGGRGKGGVLRAPAAPAADDRAEWRESVSPSGGTSGRALAAGDAARRLRGLPPARSSGPVPAPHTCPLGFQASGALGAGDLPLSERREFAPWKLGSVMNEAFSPESQPLACETKYTAENPGAGGVSCILERHSLHNLRKARARCKELFREMSSWELKH